jgi:hypothetical protein
MKSEHKDWIDSASYEVLFSRLRFSESGDPLFQDDTGDYYAEIMRKKREQIGDAQHAKISKSLGWVK